MAWEASDTTYYDDITSEIRELKRRVDKLTSLLEKELPAIRDAIMVSLLGGDDLTILNHFKIKTLEKEIALLDTDYGIQSSIKEFEYRLKNSQVSLKRARSQETIDRQTANINGYNITLAELRERAAKIDLLKAKIKELQE